MSIRLIGEADLEQYVALRREMLEDAPWAFGSSPEDDITLKTLRRRLEHPENVIVGAFVENEDGSERLVGTAGVVRSPKQKRRHVAQIWGVYVTPEQRRWGLGGLIVASAIEQAALWEGVTRVGLSVSVRSFAARSLYKRFGFERWGREPGAIRLDDGADWPEEHLSLPLQRERAGALVRPVCVHCGFDQSATACRARCPECGKIWRLHAPSSKGVVWGSLSALCGVLGLAMWMVADVAFVSALIGFWVLVVPAALLGVLGLVGSCVGICSGAFVLHDPRWAFYPYPRRRAWLGVLTGCGGVLLTLLFVLLLMG